MTSAEIELRPMSEAEFAPYRAETLASYAAEKMKAEGLTRAEADRLAMESVQMLLPDGIQSKDQFLYSIVERKSGRAIGTLWFAKKGAPGNPRAFIYDIVLSPEHQGKGYGKQAMRLLEEKVRALGLKSIGLHVFGHNERARALYDQLGYRVTNVMMSKELE